MDHEFNVYANVESLQENPCTRKSEMQSAENVYENVLFHTLEPTTTGSALSGN